MAKQDDNGGQRGERQEVVMDVTLLPPSGPSVFANHMLIQADRHECHLVFHEIRPPVIRGETAEERMKELEAASPIEAPCVARVVVSAGRIRLFAKTLMEHVDKHFPEDKAK